MKRVKWLFWGDRSGDKRQSSHGGPSLVVSVQNLRPAFMPQWFEPGDHLWKKGGRFGGKLYDHHLIYKQQCEDGHLIIENSFRAQGVVEKCLSDNQLRRYMLYERPSNSAACLAKAEAAARERRSYSLLRYNCETFANECARGDGGSMQVRRATGHVALLSTAVSSAVTAMTVGLVTPERVTVHVPAKGCFGLWAWLGYTHPVVKTMTVTHPVGIAAAAGATCGCCVWGAFAALGRDVRKKPSERSMGQAGASVQN